jgi:ferrous iron transport protein A
LTVADLKSGKKARIKTIDFAHPSSFRIMEYGFTPGQEIEIINKAFLGDPLSVSLRGTLIAIRKADARCIEVDNEE